MAGRSLPLLHLGRSVTQKLSLLFEIAVLTTLGAPAVFPFTARPPDAIVIAISADDFVGLIAMRYS